MRKYICLLFLSMTLVVPIRSGSATNHCMDLNKPIDKDMLSFPLGYTQFETDHSFYTKHVSETFTALLVYVHDIVLTGDSIMEINIVKDFLH